MALDDTLHEHPDGMFDSPLDFARSRYGEQDYRYFDLGGHEVTPDIGESRIALRYKDEIEGALAAGENVVITFARDQLTESRGDVWDLRQKLSRQRGASALVREISYDGKPEVRYFLLFSND